MMDDDDFDFDFDYELSPDDEPPDFDGGNEEQPNEIGVEELLEDAYQTGNSDENFEQAMDDAGKLLECREPIGEFG